MAFVRIESWLRPCMYRRLVLLAEIQNLSLRKIAEQVLESYAAGVDEGFMRRFAASRPALWTEKRDQREKLSQADRENVLRVLRREGITQKECAAKFGVTPATITKIVQQARARKSRQKLQGASEERALGLLRAGNSQAIVAKRFGVGATTIGRVLHRHRRGTQSA